MEIMDDKNKLDIPFSESLIYLLSLILNPRIIWARADLFLRFVFRLLTFEIYLNFVFWDLNFIWDLFFVVCHFSNFGIWILFEIWSLGFVIWMFFVWFVIFNFCLLPFNFCLLGFGFWILFEICFLWFEFFAFSLLTFFGD